MTLQDDMSTIARYHTGGYGPHGPDCSICAALARVRERLAKLETAAELAREAQNCRDLQFESSVAEDIFEELRSALAALEEDGTTLTGPGSSAAADDSVKAEAVGERQGRQPGPVSAGLARGGFGEVNE